MKYEACARTYTHTKYEVIIIYVNIYEKSSSTK